MKNLLLVIALISFNVYSQDSWQFSADKQKHFIAGAVPSLVASSVISNINQDEPKYLKGFIIGASVGSGLNLAKEGFDLLGFGTPSYQDLAYGVLGSLVGSAVGVGLASLVNVGYKRKNRLKL
jgi:hypothetical protein